MNDPGTQLLSGEEVVFATRKHWAAPVADSRWAVLMLLGALVLSWLQTDAATGLVGFVNRTFGLLALALFLGGAGWIVYNVVAWRTAHYTVTNRRVLSSEGLVRRTTTDTLLVSITDVRSITSVIGRGLGYGTLRIVSSSGTAGEDEFSAVREADTLKQHILEQKTNAPAHQQVNPWAVYASPSDGGPTPLELTEVLAELAKLRDAGALTEGEFDAKKVDLLARI
jgi:uncharacterized membrane protein YdbT with pleckstrin-like domain